MNVELFSVLDQAAHRYMDIYCAPTIDFALRGFKEACQTKGHQFSKFPEDYCLYHIGHFDAELGHLSSMPPHKLANASSFIHGVQLDIEDQLMIDQPPPRKEQA